MSRDVGRLFRSPRPRPRWWAWPLPRSSACRHDAADRLSATRPGLTRRWAAATSVTLVSFKSQLSYIRVERPPRRDCCAIYEPDTLLLYRIPPAHRPTHSHCRTQMKRHPAHRPRRDARAAEPRPPSRASAARTPPASKRNCARREYGTARERSLSRARRCLHVLCSPIDSDGSYHVHCVPSVLLPTLQQSALCFIRSASPAPEAGSLLGRHLRERLVRRLGWRHTSCLSLASSRAATAAASLSRLSPSSFGRLHLAALRIRHSD